MGTSASSNRRDLAPCGREEWLTQIRRFWAHGQTFAENEPIEGDNCPHSRFAMHRMPSEDKERFVFYGGRTDCTTLARPAFK